MFRPDDPQAALKELDRAIHFHNQWCDSLTHTLVCRLEPDRRDIADDADRQCRFGQWYHGPVGQQYRDHAAFVALDAEHERMHRLAARLLNEVASAGGILPADYDAFANALERFRFHLHELEQQVAQAVYQRDSLTGAEGRAGMFDWLNESRELVRRRVYPVCIALMDMDRFKDVNDMHGHLVGDRVLASAVAHIRKHLRPYDRIFRYGGEEFLILLANAEGPVATATIDRIREELTSTPLAHDAGTPVFITASFGLASLDPDASVEESIDRADQALYMAKASGRNSVRFQPA